MSARAVTFRLLPWVALGVVVIFAFAQLRARRQAEASEPLPVVVDTHLRALAAENEALRGALRALEAQPPGVAVEDPALGLWRRRASAARAHDAAGRAARRAGAAATPQDITSLAQVLMDDPSLAEGVLALVLRTPPTPGTDALVVDLVSRADDKAEARRRIGALGVVHILRGPVLEALLVAERTHVRDALADWITERDARWGTIERGRVAQARRAVADGRR